MNRIALKLLAVVALTVAALTPAAAQAGQGSTTYTGTSGSGAAVTLTVTGNIVAFRVDNDPCGQSASGQATIDERHWFGGQAGNLLFGGWLSESNTVQGKYQFLRCPVVDWKAEKQCDCKDTRVFATWYNVHSHFDYDVDRDRNDKKRQVDRQDVKLHLVVECDAGAGANCSGWAEASVSSARVTPKKIRLSCAAKDKCPERMEATKIVTIRRYVDKEAGDVTIKITHACTGGMEKTTTLTIHYDKRGWPDRRASDLNGDGFPDRIS